MHFLVYTMFSLYNSPKLKYFITFRIFIVGGFMEKFALSRKSKKLLKSLNPETEKTGFKICGKNRVY